MVDSTNRVLAADATNVFAWPAGGGPSTRLNPGDKLIEAAAFDPTGKYVATAHAWDYTVRLWHADGSGLARTLGAATASTETLRFSPDGKHLVVASKDETVQIWHMDTTTPAVLLRRHTSWVVDAQFSKDSAHLVTTSYDGTSRVWNVDGSNEEIILNRSVYAALRFDRIAHRHDQRQPGRRVVARPGAPPARARRPDQGLPGPVVQDALPLRGRQDCRSGQRGVPAAATARVADGPGPITQIAPRSRRYAAISRNCLPCV